MVCLGPTEVTTGCVQGAWTTAARRDQARREMQNRSKYIAKWTSKSMLSMFLSRPRKSMQSEEIHDEWQVYFLDLAFECWDWWWITEFLLDTHTHTHTTPALLCCFYLSSKLVLNRHLDSARLNYCLPLLVPQACCQGLAAMDEFLGKVMHGNTKKIHLHLYHMPFKYVQKNVHNREHEHITVILYYIRDMIYDKDTFVKRWYVGQRYPVTEYPNRVCQDISNYLWKYLSLSANWYPSDKVV